MVLLSFLKLHAILSRKSHDFNFNIFCLVNIIIPPVTTETETGVTLFVKLELDRMG